MKILFVCGSLEPGKDGVGDYTRRLAMQLIKTGNHVNLIALNDQYCNLALKEEQELDAVKLKVLRLPSVWSDSKKYQLADEFIDEFMPDWLGLQYVPFAFNSKGFTFGLGSFLSKLGKGRKWYIMFHELWLGVQLGASKKEIIWGFIQRKLIVSMVSKLKPKLIQTQSSLHQSQLGENGMNASLLPLFSNISIVNATSDQFLTNATSSETNEKITMVLFGSIHNTGAPLRQFANEVKAYAMKKNKQIRLILLGHGGSEIVEWQKIWNDNDLEVEMIGEKSFEEISSVLQLADYGITTTVFDKVEKSGSVAAMLEHGLNVICVAGKWKSRSKFHLESYSGVLEYKPGKLELFFRLGKNPVLFNQLELISKKLIQSLNLAI